MCKPSISIVLPVFNGEDYIDSSIKSIQNQSYEDFECIIVNDASVDNTIKLVEQITEGDKRFLVINNKKNMGLPRSLNIGFRHARGMYLTWTSDDNFFLSNAFRDMKEYLDCNPSIPMVCANAIRINQNGQFLEEINSYNDKEICFVNCVGACFMYRNEVKNVIGRYNEDLMLIEDYDYWLRILKHYGEIGHLDKILYLYRSHGKSLSATRQTEIEKKHTQLLLSNFDWIFAKLKNEPDLLTRVYFKIIQSNDISGDYLERLSDSVPEVRCDNYYSSNDKYIIFGAGKLGSKIHQIMDGNAVAFADSNPQKWGKEKEGLVILSPQEAMKRNEQYPILIGISEKHAYEVMHMLYENNSRFFCTWVNYKHNINKGM